MPRTVSLRHAATVAVALLACTPAAAIASRIDARTVLLSSSPFAPFGGGDAANPVLSADGLTIAFDTASPGEVATDGNGAVRDVVVLDVALGERRLVSAGAGGAPADGPSSDPAISADGRLVAFTSSAANLVAGDVNGVADVFSRDRTGALVLASVTPDGRPGNRPSANPDLSADGRYLVFESLASDLVAQDSNGTSDVFLRDLVAGRTVRVSVSDGGDQAAGPSSHPAISADGRVVAFESGAADLVPRDTNRTADVFVSDRRTGRLQRVSVATDGTQQNRSVAAPFRMVSDLDARGRTVVFDSEATNLAPDDRNRRSDVFLHDRASGRTRLVSANSVNVQGNNDSVSPVITPSGRYIAFQSFATNLAALDAGGPDVFVRDLRLQATTQASIAAGGAKRQPELVGQLLQRPSLSDDGTIAAFVSSATNLTPGAQDRFVDVFGRRLNPAETTVVKRSATKVTFGADDPRAKRFLCRVDTRPAFACGPTVSRIQAGRSMVVRAMGPGILPDVRGQRISTIRDRTRPTVRITVPPRNRGRRTIRGVAADTGGSGVAEVSISVAYLIEDGRCFNLVGNLFREIRGCGKRVFQPVTEGRRRWRFVLPRTLPHSLVAVYAQATDGAGNRSEIVRTITLVP